MNDPRDYVSIEVIYNCREWNVRHAIRAEEIASTHKNKAERDEAQRNKVLSL